MKTDVAVLGGGTAGLAAVREARRRGASALMVTSSPPGGDCTFTGCVPSKTLIEAAAAGVSFDQAFERAKSVVNQIAATETVQVLRDEGITVIEDTGSINEEGRIIVSGTEVVAGGVVLATGSRPAIPGIPGLQDTIENSAGLVLTSDTIWDLDDAPSTMVIVGGGAIGCELGLALAGLGVEITIIEAAERLLVAEERAASEIVERACIAAGVEVLTNHTIEQIRQYGSEAEVAVVASGDVPAPRAGDEDSHEASLNLISDAGPAAPNTSGSHQATRPAKVLRASNVLLATGRTPSTTAAPHLERTDLGFIRVSSAMQTSSPGVYAAGDVNGLSLFTHAADAMGRLAAANILRRFGAATFDTNHVPRLVFTAPEVGSIGLSEAEAAATVRGSRVAELPLSEHDRALTAGATEGYIKLIAGPRRLGGNLGGGRLLGATIVAPRAGEMISELSLLIRLDAMVGRLAQTMHPYPSWSYGLAKVAGQFFTEVEGRSARPAVA